MRKLLQPGEYRFGVSNIGAVVGIPSYIINTKDLKYAGADIWSQWSAAVNKITNKMDMVYLEIEWVEYAENIIIPFNMHDKEQRDIAKKIAEEQKLFLVDIAEADEKGHGAGSGVYVEISRGEILDWLKIEDEGGTVKEWRNAKNN